MKNPPSPDELTKAVVLLSGGMDSTAAMALMAWGDREVVAAVSVNYGQRHARELEAAAAVAAHYGVRHVVLDFTSWGAQLTSALTSEDIAVPDGHYTAPSMAITVVSLV